jgi:rhodanese-related sulfurtransferase
MLTLKHTAPRLFPILAALALISLVAACGLAAPPTPVPPPPSPVPVGKVVTTDKGQYTDISPDELNTMLEHKDFFMVDVHIPHEGLLPQVDARIPYDQITEQLDKLPADKTAKIVLTCKGGGMSKTAAVALADLGYTHVYNLAGGFVAWKTKGYPLTSEP